MPGDEIKARLAAFISKSDVNRFLLLFVDFIYALASRILHALALTSPTKHTRPHIMPVESSFPPVDVPNTDLWNFLFNRKDRPWPDDKGTFSSWHQFHCSLLKTILSVIYQDADSPRNYTHAQVQDTALEFAKGLKAVWNWKKGDVLNLFTPNCIDTPSVTWGTHWAGGVVSPANPGYTADELAYQLKDSGARAMATQVPMLPVAKAACKKVGIPEDMICLVGDQRDPAGRIKHFTSVRNISRARRFHKAKIDPSKNLAFLVYSSGTTGTPKGVELTHYNIVANVLQGLVGEGRKLTWDGVDGKPDKVLAPLPLFHIYGMQNHHSSSVNTKGVCRSDMSDAQRNV